MRGVGGQDYKCGISVNYRYLRQHAAKLPNVPDISVTAEVFQSDNSLLNAEVPSIEDSRIEMNRDSKSSCSKAIQ